jgi:hypothetical protein
MPALYRTRKGKSQKKENSFSQSPAAPNRGVAELHIRFPSAIPELEMVGYGFARDGDDFHLNRWQTSNNEVVLPIAHFSRAGEAAEPFAASGNFLQRFEQAWHSTRDAGRQADEWASEELREISRLRQKGC